MYENPSWNPTQETVKWSLIVYDIEERVEESRSRRGHRQRPMFTVKTVHVFGVTDRRLQAS